MSTSLPIVAILDWFKEAPIEQTILEGVGNVRCYNLQAGQPIPDSIGDAVVIIRFRLPTITDKELKQFKSCKLFLCASVGYDRVDLKAAASLGIKVSHLPAYCTEEVADSALCLMLMITRKTLGFVKLVEAGKWPFVGELDNLPAMRLSCKTVGIIGLGRIGTAFALRAKSLGMNVYFYDPFLKDGIEKSIGITRFETLQQLLSNSDIISIHCNLTPDNKHMINGSTLSQCKQGVIIINTARGPIIEESALVNALKSGHVAFAALDVLENEPYTDGHLSSVQNLIITPHASHYSLESVLERRITAAKVASDVIRGVPLRNIVNGI